MARMEAGAAASHIQLAFRELRMTRRIVIMRELQAARERSIALREARAEAAEHAHALEVQYERSLPGVVERVWPIVREAAAVMCAAVVLVAFAPACFDALPSSVDVRSDEPFGEQLKTALLGASVFVAAFTALFGTLLALYVRRWTATLHALHAAWIACLLGLPAGRLVERACRAAGAPLDGVSLVIATWNLTAPGVVLVHWSATEERFRGLRRAYAAALSTLTAWALCSVPWLTATVALLELAALDVLLVSLPGSPVQGLDAIATRRRAAGEPEMPGLTFKRMGLELGLGDFIVYAAFAAHASTAGGAPLLAAAVGVLSGLVPTMGYLALARRRTVVPALPLAIALGASMLAAERLMVRRLSEALASQYLFL